MKPSLRISVVTPNFNMADRLAETIASVRDNLEPGDEYFVVDGGSRDNSVDVIRDHAATITQWISEPDKGYADAIAKGFAMATGDVLCWINSGDLLLKGALANARAEIARLDADLIFGSDFYVDEQSRVIWYSHGYVQCLPQAMLFGGWTPLQDACFWTRKLYEQCGGLDRGLGYAADFDLFLRMAHAGNAQFSPVTFSAFRRHDGQKSIVSQVEYAAERAAVLARERTARRQSFLQSSLSSLRYRGEMSLRARISRLRWRRNDLIGRDVGELPAGIYWPATSTGKAI